MATAKWRFGRRIFVLIAAALIVLGAAAAGAIYLEGRNVTVHVDPADVEPPSSPNWALSWPETTASIQHAQRFTPHYSETPLNLIERFDAVALGAPKTERVDDGADPLWRTYRQRSRFFGFPDLISVRAVETDQGASLIVYSRSVYGYSDLGVNRKRIDQWLEALN